MGVNNTPSGADADAEDVSPQIEDMKLDPPDPPEPPAERNLMSGWVSTRRNSNSPSAKPQKLWLVVTDTRMLLQTEAGGETLERIDSDRLLSVGVAPSSSGGATPGRDAAHKERRFQLLVRLRAPPASPPPLTTRSRSSFESSTTALLALLSPMIGNRRRQSWQHHTQAARSARRAAAAGGRRRRRGGRDAAARAVVVGGGGVVGGDRRERRRARPRRVAPALGVCARNIRRNSGAIRRNSSERPRRNSHRCVDRLLALGRHVTSAEPNGHQPPLRRRLRRRRRDQGATRSHADVNQMTSPESLRSRARRQQQHGVIAVLLAAGADPTLAARQGAGQGEARWMARDVGCDRSAARCCVTAGAACYRSR